jgi:hypothetical protein
METGLVIYSGMEESSWASYMVDNGFLLFTGCYVSIAILCLIYDSFRKRDQRTCSFYRHGFRLKGHMYYYPRLKNVFNMQVDYNLFGRLPSTSSKFNAVNDVVVIPHILGDFGQPEIVKKIWDSPCADCYMDVDDPELHTLRIGYFRIHGFVEHIFKTKFGYQSNGICDRCSIKCGLSNSMITLCIAAAYESLISRGMNPISFRQELLKTASHFFTGDISCWVDLFLAVVPYDKPLK